MNLQSKFGYFIISQTLNIALCQWDGITDRQTDRQTDDPITRCPWPKRSFWAQLHVFPKSQNFANTVFAKVIRFLPDIRCGKQMFFTRPTDKFPVFILQREVFDEMFTRHSVWHDSKVYQIEANFNWNCLTDWQPSETLQTKTGNHYLSASSRMIILCRPLGRVTFCWANILILLRTTSMPLKIHIIYDYNTYSRRSKNMCSSSFQSKHFYLPINAWFWGYYALIVLLWET